MVPHSGIHRKVVALAVLAALAGGCGDDAGTPGATRAKVTVGAASTLDVEVAATPEERRRGLMHRDHLEPGTGMLFLFSSAEERAFWMYETLIPLSIAWVADGEVVGIAEMDPCPHDDPDKCPRFTAPAAFDLAVEAPAGTFTDADVRAGDLVRIEGDLPDAS